MLTVIGKQMKIFNEKSIQKTEEYGPFKGKK